MNFELCIEKITVSRFLCWSVCKRKLLLFFVLQFLLLQIIIFVLSEIDCEGTWNCNSIFFFDVNTSSWQQLYIKIDCYGLLGVAVCCYILLSITVYDYMLLAVAVYCSVLLCIILYCFMQPSAIKCRYRLLYKTFNSHSALYSAPC